MAVRITPLELAPYGTPEEAVRCAFAVHAALDPDTALECVGGALKTIASLANEQLVLLDTLIALGPDATSVTKQLKELPAPVTPDPARAYTSALSMVEKTEHDTRKFDWGTFHAVGKRLRRQAGVLGKTPLFLRSATSATLEPLRRLALATKDAQLANIYLAVMRSLATASLTSAKYEGIVSVGRMTSSPEVPCSPPPYNAADTATYTVSADGAEPVPFSVPSATPAAITGCEQAATFVFSEAAHPSVSFGVPTSVTVRLAESIPGMCDGRNVILGYSLPALRRGHRLHVTSPEALVGAVWAVADCLGTYACLASDTGYTGAVVVDALVASELSVECGPPSAQVSASLITETGEITRTELTNRLNLASAGLYTATEADGSVVIERVDASTADYLAMHADSERIVDVIPALADILDVPAYGASAVPFPRLTMAGGDGYVELSPELTIGQEYSAEQLVDAINAAAVVLAAPLRASFSSGRLRLVHTTSAGDESWLSAVDYSGVLYAHGSMLTRGTSSSQLAGGGPLALTRRTGRESAVLTGDIALNVLTGPIPSWAGADSIVRVRRAEDKAWRTCRLVALERFNDDSGDGQATFAAALYPPATTQVMYVFFEESCTLALSRQAYPAALSATVTGAPTGLDVLHAPVGDMFVGECDTVSYVATAVGSSPIRDGDILGMKRGPFRKLGIAALSASPQDLPVMHRGEIPSAMPEYAPGTGWGPTPLSVIAEAPTPYVTVARIKSAGASMVLDRPIPTLPVAHSGALGLMVKVAHPLALDYLAVAERLESFLMTTEPTQNECGLEALQMYKSALTTVASVPFRQIKTEVLKLLEAYCASNSLDVLLDALESAAFSRFFLASSGSSVRVAREIAGDGLVVNTTTADDSAEPGAPMVNPDTSLLQDGVRHVETTESY